MQLKKLLPLVATASAVQALAFNATDLGLDNLHDEDFDLTLEERNNGCVKGVHVVAAGGTGATKGNLGYLASLVHEIVNTIPHSNYHQVPYPPGYDAPSSIAYATPRMHAYVKNYAKKCPRSKMALVGYSTGGAVTMDVVCGDVNTGKGSLADKYKDNVAAITIYGDPTFVPNLPYDRGTCTGAQGPSDVPRAHPGQCRPFIKKIRSWCDYNDPECCNGNDVNVHFGYPGKYDGKATGWVKNRYNHPGKKHTKKHPKKHHKKHHG